MKNILKDFKEGKITIDECENLLKVNNILEFEDIANFDESRKARTGFPEAVYAEGKEYEDILAIVKNYFKDKSKDDSYLNNLILTRLSKDRADRLLSDCDYLIDKGFIFDYNKRAEILIIKTDVQSYDNPIGTVGIITAGTSDINVAEEARVIVEEGGCESYVCYDIGVAGIHRLIPKIAEMIEKDIDIIIVCAGMEGALPTVVAGLVDIPVIGVPTSVGYGVGKDGVVALNSMLQSCAPGIAVVNIDNGFGAAAFAITMIKAKK